jgi:UDP-2-acetamido-3-amino-2,3-dideoxy-glucuronate N-acetyltransferase
VTLYVHPHALCESDTVGAGTRVWAFAHVMRGAVIGSDCNIGEGVFVESGARVGDRVTLKNPSSSVTCWTSCGNLWTSMRFPYAAPRTR